MEKVICQSCGMEISEPNLFGSNLDKSKNEDYCRYCFTNGKFGKE